jgi:hypothetical protein
MATLPTLFETFLANIRPTDQQQADYINAHETLRERLQSDDTIEPIYVSDFLQGSYRRFTAVKPQAGEKSDVDVVLVSNFDHNSADPGEAMKQLEPFLDHYYDGQWDDDNDRSYKIESDRVEIDLVLTASPSEAAQSAIDSLAAIEIGSTLGADKSEHVTQALGLTAADEETDWRDDPLRIPDRRLKVWEKTHPLATIEATVRKNDKTNGHYVNVVKAIKWWRRTKTTDVEGPTSYPLEHIVWDTCPDDIESVAEGVTRTFEAIERKFADDAASYQTPELPAHQLSEVDVLDRIDGANFAEFYDAATDAATVARSAFDEDDGSSARDQWHRLFGDEFPLYGDGDNDTGDDQSAVSFGSSSSTEVSDSQFA